jgi:hypothetical protein
MTNVAHAAPLANPGGLRAAVDDLALTDNVALYCTHWWNGYWHRRLRCYETYPLYYSYGPGIYGGPRFYGSRGGIRGGGFRRGWRRSDVQLKHDVTLLGHLDNGLGFYRFSYNGSDKAYVGVMAQEVQAVMPQAVMRGSDGYLRVSYGQLGLQFQTYDAWLASGGRIPTAER